MFYAADLTPYIGRTVYIAIRHFDSEDMYYLNIDMFQIIADGSIDVAQTEPQFVYNETLANALNVEGGTLRFSTGTRFPWKVGEQNGRGFAYSMNHLPYTRSYIETRVTITEPCRLSYDWMNDAEQGMDFPTLYINGEVAVEMKYVYGEFRTQIVDITEPGEYTFAWGFWKDEEIKQSKFPVLERADVLGCFDGDTLISQFAVYPLKMNIYGEVFQVGFVTSVCTYPEYTGQGIMKKLMIQSLSLIHI